MIIFYLITLVVMIATGTMFWMIWKESSGENGGNNAHDPNAHINAASLLERIGLEKTAKKSGQDRGKKNLFSGLLSSKKTTAGPQLNQKTEEGGENKISSIAKSGTASLRLDNSPQQSILPEVELAIKSDELEKSNKDLTEKCQRLDQLLAEKTSEIEKIQKEIEQERKHRKEFNKIKDLLEKEIKDNKEAAKQTEAELQSIKAERQTSFNRISQLEEKIKLIEKKSNEKDATIHELTDNLSTLQASSKSQSTGDPITPTGFPQKDIKADIPKNQDDQKQGGGDGATQHQPQEDQSHELTIEPAQAFNPGKEAPNAEDAAVRPLNLAPISNLENSYKKDAAPSHSDTVNAQNDGLIPGSSSSPANEKIKLSSDVIIPPTNEPEPANNDIDAFLQQHLEKVTTESPIPPLIHETTEPDLDQNADLDTDNNNSTNTSLAPDKKLENQNDEGLTAPVSPKKNQMHLAPDIFKDIEEQFLKIQDEMAGTQEDTNIQSDDQNDPTNKDK